MRFWPRILMALALALTLAVAGDKPDKQRVKGKAFGNPSKPPVTNRPPADRVEDDEAYDVDEGVYPAGVFAYELKQGERLDNKGRWAKTDYIEWALHGATLQAKGQCHDSDSTAATIVSSDAWGAEIITVIATAADGKYAWIAADNQINFKYRYLISGDTIGEASVQLQGSAFDIKGNEHSFNLNDQRAENVKSEESKKSGFEEKDYDNLRVFLAHTEKGSSVRVSGDTGSEKKTYQELEAKISRRYATAGGDNDTTPTVVIRKSSQGSTPMEETFSVFSDSSVVLRARAGKVPEGKDESTVVVELKEFDVRNSLIAYKAVADEPFEPPDLEPPPPPPTGHAPGPTTPSDPGAPDTGHADGPETAGDDDEDEAESDDNSLGPVEWIVYAPHGLDGEAGSLPGWLTVSLPEPVTTDTVFGVEAGVGTECMDNIVVMAGRRHASIPLIGLQAGAAEVLLRDVDTEAPVAAVSVVLRSVTEHPTARLWAVAPSRAGRRSVLRGLVGDQLTLQIGRLGFAGLEEEDTVVQVVAEDPLGVLAALPADVTIPAGKTHCRLDLQGVVAGVAQVRLVAGAEVVAVTVVVRQQAWDASPTVRVPLGATAPIPILMEFPVAQTRVVDAVVANAAIATTEAQAELRRGESAWFLTVTGVALGTTSVTLSSAGLSAQSVAIKVVPAQVTVVNGVLKVTGLSPTTVGTLLLWVSAEARIASLQLPASDTLRAEGVGGTRIVLHVDADPDRTAELLLPIQFDGDPADLSIVDMLRAEETTVYSFRVPLR